MGGLAMAVLVSNEVLVIQDKHSHAPIVAVQEAAPETDHLADLLATDALRPATASPLPVHRRKPTQPAASQVPAVVRPSASPSPTDVWKPKKTETQIVKPPAPIRPVLRARPALRRPAEGLAEWVDRLPTLDELAQLFPKSFRDVEQEKDYISTLDDSIRLSAEDYRNLHINTDYEHAFDSQPNSHLVINPTMFVIHWTATDYKHGVQSFIKVMRDEGLRVEYFIDRQGTIYQLFDNDHHYPAHALGVNSFSQGVEIEATGAEDYTPEQLTSAALLALHFCRENGLAVSSSTILGHYAVDLLYDNPTYDKYSGTFHKAGKKKPYLGKVDPPQEIIDFIVHDNEELARKLND